MRPTASCVPAGTLLLLSLLLPVLHASPLADGSRDRLSYAELAASSVAPAVEDAIAMLDLHAGTSPDDVKPLRKAILAARDLLDMFSYAYGPPARGWHERKDCTYNSSAAANISVVSELDRKSLDLWHHVRRDMVEGYEVIGDFQVTAAREGESHVTRGRARPDLVRRPRGGQLAVVCRTECAAAPRAPPACSARIVCVSGWRRCRGGTLVAPRAWSREHKHPPQRRMGSAFAQRDATRETCMHVL